MSNKKMQALSEVDIRKIDKNELVDVADIRIDPELSADERIREYMQQVKNPYCYLDHGMVVKITFNENGNTLEECLKRYMTREILRSQEAWEQRKF